ncbi:SDR family oxidoreductase [Sphingorhabdus sp.]|jgi:NAD(P)-dependent dehydrogenase (short-subunit alcohol dehydrogenase family)|uniref:SDR family oxidoreductase n=1 Tax=Sphingorhabdus sp. TaxID=1902408 RepID=UPI0040548BEF
MTDQSSTVNRIVFTGPSGALGSAVALYLRGEGWELIGIDLSEQGPEGIGFYGGIDLTDQDAVENALARIAEGGKIAGLVNIAGGFIWETLGDSDAQSWERMFRMNVLSPANTSRAALPHFAEHGSIVNIGAAAAKAAAGMGAYTAAKSGVARLTEALAEEVKDQGLRVNAVMPSIIDTPANRAAMGEGDADKWVAPEELARVIAFLLSKNASAITGACIPVTGRV